MFHLTRWINPLYGLLHLIPLSFTVFTPLRPTASHQNQRRHVPISQSNHASVRGPRHVDHAIRTVQQATDRIETASWNDLVVRRRVSGGSRFLQAEPLPPSNLNDGLCVGVERHHSCPHAATKGHPGEAGEGKKEIRLMRREEKISVVHI